MKAKVLIGTCDKLDDEVFKNIEELEPICHTGNVLRASHKYVDGFHVYVATIESLREFAILDTVLGDFSKGKHILLFTYWDIKNHNVRIYNNGIDRKYDNLVEDNLDAASIQSSLTQFVGFLKCNKQYLVRSM